MNIHRFPLATKLLGLQIMAIVLIGTLALGLLFLSIRAGVYAGEQDEGEKLFRVITEMIAQHEDLIGDPALSVALQRVVSKTADVDRISLVDHTLRITADSDLSQRGKLTTQTSLIQVITEARPEQFFYTHDGRNYMRISEPIHGAYDPVRKSDIIGALSIDLSLNEAEQRMQTAFIQMALLLTASMVVFWGAQYGYLRRVLLDPLRGVILATERFGRGEYATRLPAGSGDEVGQLAQAFNTMAATVEHANVALQALAEERLRAEEAVQQAHTQLTLQMDELGRRTGEMHVLTEMGELLQTTLSAAEAYTVIARYMTQLFPDCRGGVYLISNSRNLLEAAIAWGDPAPTPIFAPPDCWALRRGQIHHGAATALFCAHVGEPSPVDYVCVPMMAQGQALGVVSIQSDLSPSGEPRCELEAKRNLVVTVADHLALALANLQLREVLRQQSIRDALTGLLNRRYLDEMLERETRRALRNGTSIGIIMVDIDRFKSFNDMYGHEAGDAVLQHMGKLLKSHVRDEDVACRFGGEEFVVVLPGAPLETACERAEQLRQDAERMSVRVGGQSLPSLTLSLGVAVFPANGESGDAVIQAADAALYRAKRGGRNRFEIADRG